MRKRRIKFYSNVAESKRSRGWNNAGRKTGEVFRRAEDVKGRIEGSINGGEGVEGRSREGTYSM